MSATAVALIGVMLALAGLWAGWIGTRDPRGVDPRDDMVIALGIGWFSAGLFVLIVTGIAWVAAHVA